ncbi:MAG: hypothetical protein GC185_13555 [Alphaproteobacteria bacterium]|nr:hypothetical protein [Alphaproteobacteria bacterium]
MDYSGGMISARQIQDVLTLAREAGRKIKSLQDTVTAETKRDGSPVSAADRLAADIVLQGLARLTPDIPVVCEENSAAQNAAARAGAPAYWIVDPLDGTRSYLDGYGGYGVHIGLIAGEQPLAGAIYFPVEARAYFTDGASGAWRQDDGREAQKISAPDTLPAGAPGIAVSWGVEMAARRGARALPYDAVAGVGGGRLCLVADGTVQAALMETPLSYWDVAAAHAVLKAAGGGLFALDGLTPLSYPAARLHQPPSMAGRLDIVTALSDVATRSLKDIGCG